MTDVQDIIKKVKEELDKLRDVDNDKVKEVITGLDKYVASLDLPAEETTEEVEAEETTEETEKAKEEETEAETEETKEETEEETTEEEEKAEEEPEAKDEEEAKDGKEEAEPVEETKEEPNVEESEKELSMEVSEKLKEAAVEMGRFEKELKAKDEVIGAHKAKITELNKELDVYKEQEQIELEKMRALKLNRLVELYKDLGIKKDIAELKKEFSQEQINKLIIDLSAVNNVRVEKKSVRETKLSPELELNKYTTPKKNSMNEEDRARAIFGL